MTLARLAGAPHRAHTTYAVARRVVVGPQHLPARLSLPDDAHGLALLLTHVHGAPARDGGFDRPGLSRRLHAAGVGTLGLDALAPVEAHEVAECIDLGLATQRLLAAIDWIAHRAWLSHLPLCLVADAPHAGAAAWAAAQRRLRVRGVLADGTPAGADLMPALNLPEGLLVPRPTDLDGTVARIVQVLASRSRTH